MAYRTNGHVDDIARELRENGHHVERTRISAPMLTVTRIPTSCSFGYEMDGYQCNNAVERTVGTHGICTDHFHAMIDRADTIKIQQ